MASVQRLAARLHDGVASGAPDASIDRTLAQIGAVNAALTLVENKFSSTLSAGSRSLAGIILTILAAGALTVGLSGLLFTVSVARKISARLKAMLSAAERLARGDSTVILSTGSNDELGRLASAFNDMARDIEAERRKSAQAARAADAALREAQRVAHLGSWDWDIRKDVFTSSIELRRLLGFPSSGETPSTYAAFIAGINEADRKEVDSVLRSACTMREPFAVDFRVAQADGSSRWLCAQGTVEEDPTGEPVRLMGTAMDITERKKSLEQFEYLAQHDSLTGLPNRLLLLDRLRQAIGRARREGSAGALMFLDVDNFKDLNDTFGHPAGDALLVQVGERIRARVRDVDTVARAGGDEFLIVLNSLKTPEACEVVARVVMGAFSELFELDGYDVRVSASIGTAIFPQDGVDAETLIRRADAMMYATKKRGHGHFESGVGQTA